MSNPERERVAAAALGLGSAPSHSAVAWAVAHAVALECGRKPDDAAAIADRWSTVADMAAGSPVHDANCPCCKDVPWRPKDAAHEPKEMRGGWTLYRDLPTKEADELPEDRICPKCGDLDCPIGLCRNRT